MKKRINISLDADLLERLRKMKVTHGIAIASVINIAVREYLAKIASS